MFALYVCRMSCKLELKTLNNRKMTASLRNHRKRRVCSNPCICTTQWYSGVFSRVLHEIWRIFLPIVWYCCNIQCPYKISNILYKTNEKAVSFLSTTSRTSCDLSRAHSFSCLCSETPIRCVVVSFSGAMSVQWSDVEHALCAFPGACWDYFQVFCQFGCAKWKYCQSSRAKDLKPVFILSRVQHEEFHYDKAISCKSYVQLLIQDVYSVSSKTCQL